jgi:hypothetical protein
MASPSPPPAPRSSSGSGTASGSGNAISASPVDALFLHNLKSRIQLRPPFLDTKSFLTQDLDDFLLNEFAMLSAVAPAHLMMMTTRRTRTMGSPAVRAPVR